MTPAEVDILEFFRRYQVGPAEMLFFNPGDCKLPDGSFQNAMKSLMDKGLVVKERPRRAYSLTRAGYQLSIHVEDSRA